VESNSSTAHSASHSPADWLLGAGVAYLISFPLVFLGAEWLGQAQWPYVVFWIIGIGINAPHYGATLARVYGNSEERQKYAFFTTGVTLLLVAAYATGLRSPLVAAVLVTLYFTWSPWHFAGQNYGVALMFLRRAGIVMDDTSKRLFYASFALSFALAFIALHVAGADSTYAPAGTSGSGPDALVRLGIPRPFATNLAIVFGGAYIVCIGETARRMLRVASASALLPAACLVLCQALWFAVPALMDLHDSWEGRPLVLGALWISAAHSLQYMWVTHGYARRNAETKSLRAYALQIFVVGSAAVVLPGILGAPQLLGTTAWKEGVAILAFSTLNLHHFVLDGAVWKLRDGRIARLLLQRGFATKRDSGIRRRPAWQTGMLWTVGALCVLVNLGELLWREADRRGAATLAGRTLDALELVGRTHDDGRIVVGRKLLADGEPALARVQFERSLAARETADAYGGLGRSYQMEGTLALALEAYRNGLELEPDNAALLRRAALTLLQQDDAQKAIPLFERSLALEPDHEKTLQFLSRARSQAARRSGSRP
jgi:tetratricopeptide (TPR) repeat protein